MDERRTDAVEKWIEGKQEKEVQPCVFLQNGSFYFIEQRRRA
jgi:hypothetical protein